jgi:hypothetical protein
MALLDSTLCFWRTASKADHSNAEFLAELNRPIPIVILVSEGTNGILTSEVLTTEDRGCMHHFFATSPSSCDRSHESIGMDGMCLPRYQCSLENVDSRCLGTHFSLDAEW